MKFDVRMIRFGGAAALAVGCLVLRAHAAQFNRLYVQRPTAGCPSWGGYGLYSEAVAWDSGNNVVCDVFTSSTAAQSAATWCAAGTPVKYEAQVTQRDATLQLHATLLRSGLGTWGTTASEVTTNFSTPGCGSGAMNATAIPYVTNEP